MFIAHSANTKMKVSEQSILIAISILTLLSVPIIFFTDGSWRIILGYLLLMFFPGYSFLAALFPRKNNLNGIERLALSFGLSCAIVVMIGLALNYMPWGIRLSPFVIAISCFIILTAAIGWYQQQKLPPIKRTEISLCISFSIWSKTNRTNKVLIIVLASIVIILIGLFVYMASIHK
jgi:uncharacterized membrane protein